MARNTISPRAARILFHGIGLLLLLQFWGLAAMDLLTEESVEYHKGRPPTEARRDAQPAAYRAMIQHKLALGAVLGGFFLLLAEGIWHLNRIYLRNDPEALGRERIPRKWWPVFASIGFLLLASYAFVFWKSRYG